MDTKTTASRPVESVAGDLVASCRAVAQHTGRFLVLLREFDMGRGYREARGEGPSADDSAAWLDARCGLGEQAIREKLRVAYALLNLPATEAAFQAGELTFCKVRALAEVATLANETALLDFARAMTDAQVVDYCKRLARGGYTPGRT